MPKSSKRDMTKGPILPHVFRMAIPMTIGIGSIISFSLVDTYFIGLLGADELAAIGFTFPVTTLLFNLIFGMAIAMSAVVSRRIGAGAMNDVRATVSIGLFMVFGLSVFLSIMGYIFMNPIFFGIGAGVDVMPLINDYMSIWFVGAVFLSVPVVANSAIRGMGDAFWPACVMVTVAVVNAILDPILIFGLFGLPAMGIKGAAYASLCGYIAAAIAVFYIMIIREKIFSIKFILDSSAWKIATMPLLAIAIPVSLASVITPIVSYGYTAILSGLGNEAVAGFGVATRFEAFALIPIMAMAGGIAPLIGQNYGAGLTDRVNEAITKALKFGVGYAIGCAIFLGLMSDILGTLFSQNMEVHGFVARYLILIPISYVGLNVFLVTTSAMNAMGRAKTALILNLIKSFVVALPFAWVMTDLYDLTGFLLSIMLTNFIAFVCAGALIKSLYCKADKNILH